MPLKCSLQPDLVAALNFFGFSVPSQADLEAAAGKDGCMDMEDWKVWALAQ